VSNTGLDLEALEKLYRSSTPGRWFTVQQPWRPSGVGSWIIAGSDDPHAGTPVLDSMEIEEWPADRAAPDYSQSDADLEFVAAAKNAFPQLLSLSRRAGELPQCIDGAPMRPGMRVWRKGDLWLEDDESSGPFDTGIEVTEVVMLPNNRRDGGIKWRVRLEGCPADELYNPDDLYSSWELLHAATKALNSAAMGGR